MAKNTISTGSRVPVVASADHASGDFVVEQGLHGLVPVKVLSGAHFDLDISQQVVRVPISGSPALGAAVYIGNANGLSTTSTNHRLVGIVVATPQVDTAVLGPYDDVPTGSVDILVLPQNTTAPSGA